MMAHKNSGFTTKLIHEGCNEDLLRLYVGIENVEDIIEDLNQAFVKV
jgi:cystathionine beta-lyase/cystathionine gamma-synthase